MISWNEVIVEQERRRSEIEVAQKHRQHRHILSLIPRQENRYERLLVSMGGMLITLGERLQSRTKVLTEGEEYMVNLITDPLSSRTPRGSKPC